MDRLITAARAHLAHGDEAAALCGFEQALGASPEYALARIGFAECLSRRPDLALRSPERLREALTWDEVDPQVLARAVAARLRSTPDDALLETLLEEAIVTDRDLEAQLTGRRREICLNPAEADVGFARSLAEQGRLNEFVWAVSDEEQQRLRTAPDWVRAMYADGSPEPMPLPAIGDSTSDRVRRQYEQNPYPRWRRLTLTPPESLDRQLTRLVGGGWQPTDALRDPDVLVVGCGTGQDLLTVARLWQHRSITGVDLSATSLRFAASMARRYRLQPEFIQADLLELDGWDRRFDVIVCWGVLHHLDDPLQGWRILTGLLRPGGVMAIGLYSQTARQGITAAQAQVRRLGLAPTTDGIRAARAHLNEGPWRDDCALLLDYFHTSGCRDLLFHVQEHQMTIPGLAQMMAGLGLRFLQFQTTPQVRWIYDALFGVGPSLACWEAFERMFPRTFLGMYRFWCQRPDRGDE